MLNTNFIAAAETRPAGWGWIVRLGGWLALNALLGAIIYVEAGIGGAIDLPQRQEVNLVTGEMREVQLIGPVVHVQRQLPGTDFFQRYVGQTQAAAWRPLAGEGDTVTALGHMVDEGRLFPNAKQGAGLTTAAKSELIKRTLQLLRVDMRAAAHYLCEVYRESLSSRLPLGAADLPGAPDFLHQYRLELSHMVDLGSGCADFYTAS